MARLKVRRHQVDFAELQLEPGKSYIIGRRQNADLMLQPDPGISREHISIEFVNNEWVVKGLSPHIPISYEGKTQTKIAIKDGVAHFYVLPYEFELQMINEESAPAQEPLISSSGPEASKEDPSSSAEVEAQDIIREPLPGEQSNSPAFQAELSFHGNEEQTNEIQISGEPYIKFMHASHTESLRLKGNKWVAGRDSIAQIQLDDKKASRQHFSLEKVGEQFFIKDLQSANGTLLNGQELPAHEPRELKSGDIITVNQLTMIFEMRDLSFSEKLKDLPLQAYSGPLILSSQEWDLAADTNRPPLRLETKELSQMVGTAQKVNAQTKTKPNHLRTALLAGVALMILGYAFFGQNSAPPNSVASDVKSFESLSAEEKKFVVDSYNSAQNYYQEGRIQNALTQLAYVHKTLPFYKDSRELETKLQEAQETLRQKEFIAQQRREQEETRLKVQNIVADCHDRYRDSVDVTAAKSCLANALQLDPENSDALSIVAEIELRLNLAQEAERKLKEFNDNAQKGRDLFYRAKNFLQNKDYHEAITAFSAHISANLPDPDQLKPISQRNVASIEQHINTQKKTLMGRASYQLNNGKLREAILTAEQAKRVDPYDYSIANFIEQSKRSLEMKMKPLYEESVIEERFGNFELCKAKWQEIVSKDIPTGEYYLKAKRKLQQYGL
ncbi:FHA domain-containing protein [bacterium]|nr:FHA domain-containing protein [bacterium]